MNAPTPSAAVAAPACRELVFAALGALVAEGAGPDGPDGIRDAEARFLLDAWQRVGATPGALRAALAAALAAPQPGDTTLQRAATLLGLSAADRLMVALLAAVEDDPVAGRLIAWLQAAGGGPASARPSLALLARAFAPLREDADAQQAESPTEHDSARREAAAVYALAFGPAVRAGLLRLEDDERPLCERSLRMPGALAAALAGIDVDWPGTTAPGSHAPPLEAELQAELNAEVDAWASRLATASAPNAAPPALLLRGAHAAEARAVAQALAARLGRRLACFGAELPPGAELWLALTGRMAALQWDGAPGELLRLPPLQHGSAPLLVLAGWEGGVRRDDGALAEWRLPRASLGLRRRTWQRVLGDAAAAEAAARRYRASATHLAEHAQIAAWLVGPAPSSSQSSTPSPQATRQALADAARQTRACRALDALAQPLPEAIDENALVVGDAVAAELQRALQRCAQRESLVQRLGIAARTRAGSGVRILFTGASGTGKSLAGQWLATRLGLPAYRVDLASLTSKWIGETEKNLAELLARADEADALLLFDEADSLFGKRTDVASANDRFANAQTNYLLQRIETHGGVVVLTANSRSRFDPAFVRRLDFIIDFAAPDAQARRALWRAHLGPGAGGDQDPGAAGCDAAQLNRLAALADFSGGHIRNAVLAAAASAGARGTPIGFDDVAAGVRAELRKLGRSAPPEL